MNRNRYLLCPECGTLSRNGWREVWRETIEKEVELVGGWPAFVDSKKKEAEFVMTIHDKCGFVSTSHQTESFLVGIIEETVLPIGEYWKENYEKMLEIEKRRKKESDAK